MYLISMVECESKPYQPAFRYAVGRAKSVIYQVEVACVCPSPCRGECGHATGIREKDVCEEEPETKCKGIS
jgi:hypothetical protein